MLCTCVVPVLMKMIHLYPQSLQIDALRHVAEDKKRQVANPEQSVAGLAMGRGKEVNGAAFRCCAMAYQFKSVRLFKWINPDTKPELF